MTSSTKFDFIEKQSHENCPLKVSKKIFQKRFCIICQWEAEITAIDTIELDPQVFIEFLTPRELKYSSSSSLKVFISFKIHRQGSNFHAQNAKHPKIPLLVFYYTNILLF